MLAFRFQPWFTLHHPYPVKSRARAACVKGAINTSTFILQSATTAPLTLALSSQQGVPAPPPRRRSSWELRWRCSPAPPTGTRYCTSSSGPPCWPPPCTPPHLARKVSLGPECHRVAMSQGELHIVRESLILVIK